MTWKNPFEALLIALIFFWVGYQFANPLLYVLRDGHFVGWKRDLLRVISIMRSNLKRWGAGGFLAGTGRKLKKNAESFICSSKRWSQAVDKAKSSAKKILKAYGEIESDPAWLTAPPCVLNRYRYALLFQVHYG